MGDVLIMLKIKNRNSKFENLKTWSQTEKEAWRPPEEMTVTQRADKYRYLPAGTAFGTRYNSLLSPQMVEPQNAFTDPEVEGIVIMSSVQNSKSTAEENMLFHIIDQDPSDTLFVVPREEDIEYTSQHRIKQMILLSPQLARHTTGSPRDLQGTTFKLDRMSIFFTISGSAASLATKNIRYIFLEEPDKFPLFTGREANPLDLVEKRSVTYWDAKFVLACTPTTKSGYTYQAWDWSNKQRLHIPCPKCGEYKVWQFEKLRTHKLLRDPDEIITKNDCWYECELCKFKIREIEKPRLVKAGRYVAEGQTIDRDGNIAGAPQRSKRISGYQVSGLVSQFPRMSWCRILAAWFRANTEEGIAAGKRMDFSNNYMGEPYEPSGKQLKASDVRKLEGFFSRATVPADVVCLVAAADYHKPRGFVRIDYELSGFAIGGKNYVIDTGSVPGWDEYDKRILESPFPWSDGTKNETKPWLGVCISFEDSGYEPDDVYEHCRKRPGFSIPTKGLQGPELKPLRFSDIETGLEQRQRRRHTRLWYRGMQLLLVDTHYFKNQVTSWAEPTFEEDPEEEGKLKVKSPPLMQTYIEIPSFWATEFTNEKLMPVLDKHTGIKKYIWQPVFKGAATHALDLRVLCAAAAFYKGIQYARQNPKPEIRNPKPTIKRSGFLDDLPSLT